MSHFKGFFPGYLWWVDICVGSDKAYQASTFLKPNEEGGKRLKPVKRLS